MAYADARPALEAYRGDLPVDLRSKSPAEIEAAWPSWTARHNEEIRGRLERGYEDSIVHFWVYGTSFTKLPRVTPEEVTRIGRAATEDLLIARLDDFVEGIASPGSNERLQFAAEMLRRNGIDPSTPAGKDQASVYLVETRARLIKDNDRYQRAAQAAKRLTDSKAQLSSYSTLYRDRGLSSDTSLLADYGLDRALEAMKAKGTLGQATVRRVAVIGPGLDFTDKAEGYDFYPQQTIQPFALIDSLIRHGFSTPADLRLTTFDLSPRVNQHLEAARRRSQAGEAYVVQLPMRDEQRYQPHPEFVKYWQNCGDRIGSSVAPIAPPPALARGVKVRAVRIEPAIVASIDPHDLNVVVERLDGLPPSARFDLVVATNVLVYYDGFEQALALTNIASMLKPGGYFLTNYAVSPLPPFEPSASLTVSVEEDRDKHGGDTLFWYRRQ
jgi:SAM-dependent methyltransferase